MTGVSCRALGLVIDGAKRGEISLERLVEGLDVSCEYVSNSSNRISWETFTVMMERLEEQLGGPEALRRFGEQRVTTKAFQIFRYVGRALSHPRDIYRTGALWVGPSLFPMTSAEMTDLPDGRLVQRLRILEGHRDCPALFHVLHGALATMPVDWGHGYSDVELELKPREASYTIAMRSSNRGWTGRIFRAIRARIAFPSMLQELEQQQSTLRENYREIHDAHGKIAAQAAELVKVNSIGLRLSEHIDLDRLSDILIQVMLEELGVVGIELSLIRTQIPALSVSTAAAEEPRFIRRGGQGEGAPSRRYLLEAAARPLGTLDVWLPSDRQEGVSDALLDRLLPWISMALDNARTYEALERHADALEQRVKERTARLLAANHHLVREIDERQRATDALMQSEAQLRASERLASIGTLAAGIAHEINNPIGSILAAAQMAQLVRTDGDADVQISESLDDIVTQAKRCGEIVRSVLQFSRDERTEKWDYQINEIIARSIRLTEAFADENEARVRIDLPEPTPWAHINPIQIEQAIVNLLRNAIESGARDILVHVSERPGEDLASIEIRDDGPGVPPDDRLRVFEPFYTTKQNAGGAGLGLSVVHGIAAEHGGRLKLNTISGGGAAVLLEIPTCPKPTPALAEKPDQDG